MRICYFIQAHQYPDLVCRLVRTIKRSSPTSIVVIFLGERCRLDPMSLEGLSNIHLLTSKRRLIWSDFSNQVQTYLDTIDWLFENNVDFDWLINLSGQCYPTQPLKSIENFLANTQYDGFIRYWDSSSPKMPWSETLVLERYYHQYRRLHKWPVRILQGLNYAGMLSAITQLKFNTSFYQYRIGTKSKTPPFNKNFQCYGGYAWFTLSKRAVQYIRDFTKENRAIVNYYKNVIVPEESMIQTILVNSGLFNLCNDDKLYIDYTGHSDGHSRVLTIKNYDIITTGKYHFARKFDTSIDATILDLLDQIIFNISH